MLTVRKACSSEQSQMWAESNIRLHPQTDASCSCRDWNSALKVSSDEGHFSSLCPKHEADPRASFGPWVDFSLIEQSKKNKQKKRRKWTCRQPVWFCWPQTEKHIHTFWQLPFLPPFPRPVPINSHNKTSFTQMEDSMNETRMHARTHTCTHTCKLSAECKQRVHCAGVLFWERSSSCHFCLFLCFCWTLETRTACSFVQLTPTWHQKYHKSHICNNETIKHFVLISTLKMVLQTLTVICGSQRLINLKKWG